MWSVSERQLFVETGNEAVVEDVEVGDAKGAGIDVRQQEVRAHHWRSSRRYVVLKGPMAMA